MCPDQVYNQYTDRVEPTCNGSFLLKDILFEDAGFYKSVRDGQVTGYYYLHVVDPVCNVSIARIPSENGVLLYCNSTDGGASIAWTRNGGSLPESHLLTDNQTLSIPRGVACGYYLCSVRCGVLGQQNATNNLTGPDDSSLIYCPLMIEILIVGGICTASFLVQCILSVRHMLAKTKGVSGDHKEVQQKTIHSETTWMTQGATYIKTVQVALKVCHWGIVVLSSLCFLNQEFRRAWKSIDLIPVGTVLVISLFIELLLFILNRFHFFKAKVTQQRKLRPVCNVIALVTALLQQIFVIFGAAYSLTDCFNLRCMHVNTMSWTYSVTILVVPIVVLLVFAILYKRCTALKKQAAEHGLEHE